MKYCVVTDDGLYACGPDEKSLGWVDDLQVALKVAAVFKANVYDAEAFAKDPNPAHHTPIKEST